MGCVLGLCAACSTPLQKPVDSAAKDQARDAVASDGAGSAQLETEAPPVPQGEWLTTNKALGIDAQPASDAENVPAYDVDNTLVFRSQVVRRCRELKDAGEDPAPLVAAEIEIAGCYPAECTEAMIRAECGSLGGIVTSLVNAGGDAWVAPVVDRALFLAGPGAEGIIEGAASDGVKGDLRAIASTRAPRKAGTDGSLHYAMAYFPAGAEAADLQHARAGSNPYAAAEPGYAIYTFVLFGKDFDALAEDDLATYRELLRVIETYVLAAEPTASTSRANAHAFLIPVHPERTGNSLLRQVAPELSDEPRNRLASYLLERGAPQLAEQLQSHPGPFLVSGLDPRLVPRERSQARLFVDLSDIAPTMMYAIVDAYDRPVDDALSGKTESLAPIRARLKESVAEVQLDDAFEVDTDRTWLSTIGTIPTLSPGEPADQAAARPVAPEGG